MSLRVLAVVSEIFPLVKTGGLADVAGALPLALAAEGVAVRSLVPGYPDRARPRWTPPSRRPRSARCSAGPRACSRRGRTGSTCW